MFCAKPRDNHRSTNYILTTDIDVQVVVQDIDYLDKIPNRPI